MCQQWITHIVFLLSFGWILPGGWKRSMPLYALYLWLACSSNVCVCALFHCMSRDVSLSIFSSSYFPKKSWHLTKYLCAQPNVRVFGWSLNDCHCSSVSNAVDLLFHWFRTITRTVLLLLCCRRWSCLPHCCRCNVRRKSDKFQRTKLGSPAKPYTVRQIECDRDGRFFLYKTEPKHTHKKPKHGICFIVKCIALFPILSNVVPYFLSPSLSLSPTLPLFVRILCTSSQWAKGADFPVYTVRYS